MRGLCLRLAASLLFLHLSSGIPRGAPNRDNSDDNPSSRLFHQHFGKSQKPHVVMILADDLGWNDVSFHGANQIPTPNIDALAYNGVILNSHYVSALCTPSRSALMTGKYPIHLGMQHSVLLPAEPRGLPLEEKLLPQHLKDAGYKTHAVGKWHLGYYKSEYTPTYRGFDSHFGYWNGLQDYWSHDVDSDFQNSRGFDMRRNMSAAWDTVGKYSTDLFTEEAVKLISEHDTREPMFMYLAHLSAHSGNDADLYQAPDEEVAKFSYIDNPERRIYAAMVSKLDESVGEVVSALRGRGMLENSIIIFMSDNGAPTMGTYNNSGSNYPLRGIKDSAWEGGVRGAAAIWSPLIKKPRRVSNQLISIADWLPTLWSAAGMDASVLGPIDGVNMWPSLIDDRISARSEVLINIDDIDNYAAIRRGDYKYVFGHTHSGDKWYGESGRLGHKASEAATSEIYPKAVLSSKAGVAISGVITAEQVTTLRRRRGSRSPQFDDEQDGKKLLTTADIRKLRSEAVVHCNVRKLPVVSCDPVAAPCLFNIKEDPCEQINIAESRPIILVSLEQALMRYRLSAVPAANVDNDPLANPSLWNGTWTTWRDSDPLRLDSAKGATSRRISGSTIAVIAVVLGLLIVAAMTLFAIKYAKHTNLQTPTQHAPLPGCNEEAVAISGHETDEQDTEKISRGIQTSTEFNGIKDHGRSVK